MNTRNSLEESTIEVYLLTHTSLKQVSMCFNGVSKLYVLYSFRMLLTGSNPGYELGEVKEALRELKSVGGKIELLYLSNNDIIRDSFISRGTYPEEEAKLILDRLIELLSYFVSKASGVVVEKPIKYLTLEGVTIYPLKEVPYSKQFLTITKDELGKLLNVAIHTGEGVLHLGEGKVEGTTPLPEVVKAFKEGIEELVEEVIQWGEDDELEDYFKALPLWDKLSKDRKNYMEYIRVYARKVVTTTPSNMHIYLSINSDSSHLLGKIVFEERIDFYKELITGLELATK